MQAVKSHHRDKDHVDVLRFDKLCCVRIRFHDPVWSLPQPAGPEAQGVIGRIGQGKKPVILQDICLLSDGVVGRHGFSLHKRSKPSEDGLLLFPAAGDRLSLSGHLPANLLPQGLSLGF